MKKSLFALLFLLFALIITCVYQKTYALYALNTSEENTTLPLEQKAEIISPEKEETVVEKQTSTDTQAQAISKVEQNPTLLEKIKKTVVSVVSSDVTEPKEKAVTHEIMEKETLTQTTSHTTKVKKQPALNTQEEEKEVVDYLLGILEERDAALAERDETETKLQALIKKTLEQRRIAIENMDKASTEIEASHQKRLKERDTKSQNNTEEKGK